MIIDRLIEAIHDAQNPTCVGLDTDFDYLPEELTAGVTTPEAAAGAILEFNRAVIEAVRPVVPSVKVQVAYYEKYGPAGMQTFRETLLAARRAGLIVIADVKRNDIGSTAAAYSQALLGETSINGTPYTAYPCDFATVNGYLGSDGLKPFLSDCKAFDKGIFALVKTSNPSSGELQNLKFENGNTLYEQSAELLTELGRDLLGAYGYSAAGAVVGATHREEAAAIRARFPHLYFLIPGYGAQGGKAEDLVVCFDEKGRGGVVNSSRGILCAYRKEAYRGLSFDRAARRAAEDMRADLLAAIRACGKEI